MSHVFWARDVYGSVYTVSGDVLCKEVKDWLSRNLRKRPTDSRKRYRYKMTSVSVCGKLPWHRKRVRHALGVEIYNDEDAMAFRMRWL